MKHTRASIRILWSGFTTPAMIDAGVSRLWALLQAQVGLSYVAEEVYAAMRAKS